MLISVVYKVIQLYIIYNIYIYLLFRNGLPQIECSSCAVHGAFLFIHFVCNSLHLLSPNSECIATPPPPPPSAVLSHRVGALAKAQEGSLDVDGESYLLQLGQLPSKSGTGVSGMAAVREAGSLCTRWLTTSFTEGD